MKYTNTNLYDGCLLFLESNLDSKWEAMGRHASLLRREKRGHRGAGGGGGSFKGVVAKVCHHCYYSLPGISYQCRRYVININEPNKLRTNGRSIRTWRLEWPNWKFDQLVVSRVERSRNIWRRCWEYRVLCERLIR